MAYLPVLRGRSGRMLRQGRYPRCVWMRHQEPRNPCRLWLGESVDVAAIDYLTLLNVASQGQPLREFVLLQKIPGFVGNRFAEGLATDP